MRKTFITTTVVVLALTLTACATSNTTFQSTWKNPEASPLNLNGQRVLAVFMTNDTSLRHRAEDAIAAEITARGAVGVASYTVLSDADLRDSEATREKARDEGFTAAVVMRLTGSGTQYTYTPGFWTGAPYRHIWGPGYWQWGWGRVWERGYLTADKFVKAETLVYSLDQDDLVWAGTSKTFEPGRIDKFVTTLTEDVSKQMSKDGVIASL